MNEEILTQVKEEPEAIFSEREVLLSICGEDAEGNPKGMASVKLADINTRTEEETVIDEFVISEAIVNVFRTPISTTLDLTFVNPEDYEFVGSVARLQDFCKADMYSPDPDTFRTIVVTAMPKEFTGAYACGFHGSWVIQPSKVGVKNDTLRFVFDSEYFGVLQMNDDEIDRVNNGGEFTGWEEP